MDMPSHRLQTAVQLFDAANAQDPNTTRVDGEEQPAELVYARRLSEWVMRLRSEPSEPLLLAARCQHIQRWKIPRRDYPEGRAGYLKWRTDLKAFHARIAGEILAQAGYDRDVIEKVRALNLKSDFPRDPDSRVLEDALCLVFLEHQLSDLARRMDEDTLINALRKSWKKMTPAARDWAVTLPLGEMERALISQALENNSDE